MRVGDPIRILRGPLCVMPGKHAESAGQQQGHSESRIYLPQQPSLRFWLLTPVHETVQLLFADV